MRQKLKADDPINSNKHILVSALTMIAVALLIMGLFTLL